MNEQPEPMAYVAIAPCGCTKYAAVDRPDLAKDIAKEMRWAIAHGYRFERVTCAWVRENWRVDCETCKPPRQKKAKAVPEGQAVLF